MKKLFAALAVFAIITVLVSACRVVDADTLPKNPKDPLGPAVFVYPTMSISKGEKIDLVNSSSVSHNIVNGQWQGTKPVNATETGAPTVSVNVQPGSTATIGPFNTAGTYHIYCTIHQGMNLVVTVK